MSSWMKPARSLYRSSLRKSPAARCWKKCYSFRCHFAFRSGRAGNRENSERTEIHPKRRNVDVQLVTLGLGAHLKTISPFGERNGVLPDECIGNFKIKRLTRRANRKGVIDCDAWNFRQSRGSRHAYVRCLDGLIAARQTVKPHKSKAGHIDRLGVNTCVSDKTNMSFRSVSASPQPGTVPPNGEKEDVADRVNRKICRRVDCC